MRLPILTLLSMIAVWACRSAHPRFLGPLAAVADSVLASALDAQCAAAPTLGSTGDPSTLGRISHACTASGDTSVVVAYDSTGTAVIVSRMWTPKEPLDSAYAVLLENMTDRHGSPNACVRENDARLPGHVYWYTSGPYASISKSIGGLLVFIYSASPPDGCI